MLLVYILICVSIFISCIVVKISKEKFGAYLNHYVVYNVVWLLFLLLSIFCNNYVSVVSPIVYQIFFLGLICYNLTIFFIHNKKVGSFENNTCVIDIKYRRILEVIAIVSLFPMAYANFKLIQAGVELWELNYDYWHEVRGSGSYVYEVYLQSVVEPLSMLLVFTSYCSNRFYLNSNKYTPLLSVLLAAIISIEYALLSGGGRSQMMRFVYVTFFSYLASNVKFLRPYYFRFSNKIYILIVVVVLFIIQWSNVGRGKSNDFLTEAINGQIIFATLFEYYLNQTTVFANNTYGASMFEFFISFIQYPFKLLGMNFYEYYNNYFVQNFVYLSSLNKEVNAAVSAYFYYMRDFGFAGVFIGPIITACLANVLYSFSLRNVYYLIFYISGLFSMMITTGYPFQKLFWLSFIYLILLVGILKRRSVSIK